ncbi:MAG: alanine racemase [Eubacterium sp.]|nr:alanine racemase [Eubacterium sp.]
MKPVKPYHRIEARIDLSAIRRNIEAVQALNPPEEKTLLVIKADAYGHGSVTLAEKLADLADYFGVAEIDEAVELRKSGVTKPILILGYTDETEFEDLIDYDITQAVFDVEKCRSLSLLAEKKGKKARVHIKVDSGMHRIGFSADEAGIAQAEQLYSMPGLSVEGIFTHFARADEKDKSVAMEQYEAFSHFVHALEEKGYPTGIRHIDNSAGAMELHSKGFDMMRLGIVIYGLYPSEEMDKEAVPITPAMSLISHITHIKTLPAGCGISYGHTFVTERDTRVATVSAGYADGYPRAQSGKGRVLIRGEYAPILGRVCMDQFMVDVTHIPEAEVGDEVTLFGKDGENRISVEEVAEPAVSFNYELVCNVARRVPRVYIEGDLEIGEVNELRDK